MHNPFFFFSSFLTLRAGTFCCEDFPFERLMLLPPHMPPQTVTISVSIPLPLIRFTAQFFPPVFFSRTNLHRESTKTALDILLDPLLDGGFPSPFSVPFRNWFFLDPLPRAKQQSSIPLYRRSGMLHSQITSPFFPAGFYEVAFFFPSNPKYFLFSMNPLPCQFPCDLHSGPPLQLSVGFPSASFSSLEGPLPPCLLHKSIMISIMVLPPRPFVYYESPAAAILPNCLLRTTRSS